MPFGHVFSQLANIHSVHSCPDSIFSSSYSYLVHHHPAGAFFSSFVHESHFPFSPNLDLDFVHHRSVFSEGGGSRPSRKSVSDNGSTHPSTVPPESVTVYLLQPLYTCLTMKMVLLSPSQCRTMRRILPLFPISNNGPLFEKTPPNLISLVFLKWNI